MTLNLMPLLTRQMLNAAVPPEVHYAGEEQGMMGVVSEPSGPPPGKSRALKKSSFSAYDVMNHHLA